MNNLYYNIENDFKLLKSHKNFDVLYRYALYIGKKKKLFMVLKGDGFSMTIDKRF